jgi:hypothetical protein
MIAVVMWYSPLAESNSCQKGNRNSGQWDLILPKGPSPLHLTSPVIEGRGCLGFGSEKTPKDSFKIISLFKTTFEEQFKLYF